MSEENESKTIAYDDGGEITETVGQAWCRCSYLWGVDNYVMITSSQGLLALCEVRRVVGGPESGKVSYVPLTREDLHEL